MKKIALLNLIIVLLQLSCVSYKKEIYRSDSRLNKGYEIIDSLKVPARVKIRLKNGDRLYITIIMYDDKEIYGSTKPVGEIYNKIIPFEDIEYVKLGEDKSLQRFRFGLLGFAVIFSIVYALVSYPIN